MSLRLALSVVLGLAFAPSACDVRPEARTIAADPLPRASFVPAAISSTPRPMLSAICRAQLGSCRTACPNLAPAEDSEHLAELAHLDVVAYRACDARRAACVACLDALRREGVVE